MNFFQPNVNGVEDNRQRNAEYEHNPKRAKDKESELKGSGKESEEKILLYDFGLHALHYIKI